MILVSAVLVGSAPWAHRVVVAGALVAPVPTALALLWFGVRARRHEERPALGAEALALLDVLAGLKAGRTLRSSLAGLSGQTGRLVAVGAPTEALAASVASALPTHGPMAAAAVRLLDEAGGPAIPVMEELATQAAEMDRVRRELRSAVAAPVLQGVLVGGAPLAVLVWLVVSGGFARAVTATPAHAVVVVAGAVMTLAGAVWVAAIVRRSMP